MRRNTLNFLIDAVTLIVMLAMIGTGVLLKYVLPPGSRGGHGLSLWSMGRHDWGDLHFWLAVALVGLLLLHVALHWTWVCTLVKRWLTGPDSGGKPSTVVRNAYGVGFLGLIAAIVAAFVWIASESVVGPGGPGRGEERAQAESPPRIELAEIPRTASPFDAQAASPDEVSPS